MKIAMFTDVFLEVPGGIPSSIKAQKKGLEAQGHEVKVFAPGVGGDVRRTGGANGVGGALAGLSAEERRDIVLVPTHRWLKVNGAPLSKRPGKVERAVLAQFQDFDFDLVHVHYEASCSLAGMRLARRFQRPLVVTMHGREDMAVQVNVPLGLKSVVASVLCFLHGRYVRHELRLRKGGILSGDGARHDEGANDSGAMWRAILAPTWARAKMWELMVNHANFADRVITPSRHFAEKMRTMGVWRPIAVVSNGVDDKMVAEIDARAQKLGTGLERRREPGEPLKIFWNSRLSNEKRIMPFLQALTLMREPVLCSFVGDGNALNKAKRFARKHKLIGDKRERLVRFYGRVPHEEVLEKMLSQHLSATVSYDFDTQGLTLLEAEATGMPVFFCDPDMRESMPEGGFVMAKGPSPEEMARALDALAQEPERIAEMSRVMLAHRAEILQSAQIEKLLEVYKLM